MTSSFDVQPAGAESRSRFRKAAGPFRVIALAEALTWVGLVTGMYFKYVGTPRTETGVHVFGMAHGLVFVAFVVAALLVGLAFQWSARVWVLALLASIVPLGSVIFLIWADRTGRMTPRGDDVAAPPNHSDDVTNSPV